MRTRSFKHSTLLCADVWISICSDADSQQRRRLLGGVALREQPPKLKATPPMFNKLMKNEEGVTAIEYGLIAALIAVVIIAAVRLIGTNLDSKFDTIGSELAK
jgi:pilus assembly protein Flp/PilA